jgi:hypothetical protein
MTSYGWVGEPKKSGMGTFEVALGVGANLLCGVAFGAVGIEADVSVEIGEVGERFGARFPPTGERRILHWQGVRWSLKQTGKKPDATREL